VTETDTEIVAHLVERETKDDGLENAVRRALLYMRGLFALGVDLRRRPNKIVTVRNGPPIVVGLGRREFFVASDIPAILAHTRDVVFMGDRGDGGHHRRRASSSPDTPAAPVSEEEHRGRVGSRSWPRRPDTSTSCSRRSSSSRWRIKDTVLGARSVETGKVFLHEIEIPDHALWIIERDRAPGVRDVVGTRRWVGKVPDPSRWRACRWTSDYGSSTATAIRSTRRTRSAVVITQSGETADTLAALRKRRRRGRAASRSATSSAAWRRAKPRATVYTHAGPEIGVARRRPSPRCWWRCTLLAVYLGQDPRHACRRRSRARHLEGLTQLPILLERR
jgi:glucosamine--fructose-6-phosphate aminotransferase (isomerizing)